MEIERAVVGQRFRFLQEIAGEAVKEISEPLSYWYPGAGRFEVILDRGLHEGLVPVGVVGSDRLDTEGHDQAENRNLKLARFWAAFSPVAVWNLLAFMRDSARFWQQVLRNGWEHECNLEEVLRDILSRPEVLETLRGDGVLERATALLREAPEPPELPRLDDRTYDPIELDSPHRADPLEEDCIVTIGGQRVRIKVGTEVPVKRQNGTIGRFSVDEIRRKPDGEVMFGVTEADDLFAVSRKWISVRDILSDWA